ncbi:MAG: dicarboxylate/amino acid:cation symporter [Coriobacteriia bacterium]|nr:dicarboxylate/amino acid:cation symporter [Coriobacteriia bacterium]
MEQEENVGLTGRVGKYLLLWVIIAIILGIVLGLFMPNWFVAIFATFNDIFGKFLSFAVPLIILGLIAPAIADLGKSGGKWLLVTIALAYGSTIVAGVATYFVANAMLPNLLAGQVMPELAAPENAVGSLIQGIDFPPIFGVTSALLSAFIMGICMASLKTDTLIDMFHEFKDIIMLLITRAIVPLLPLHIMGIFMNMAKSGQIAMVIVAMLKVIVLSIVLTLVYILIQYIIAGGIAGKNPFVAIKNMLPAYFTALGTSSSAATIPVTYKSALKNGVSEEVAGFTIPLCATIHLAGSTIKITTFAMAVMFMLGWSWTFPQMLGFILLLGITMVAAPGVPGGAITAAQAILVGTLGFTDPMYGLMVALYIAIDSFGTACNVTGDGAISLIVNKFARGSVKGEQVPAELMD